ncbi:MAG: hypothetical protein HZA01_03960 [Nitrospinae bacterium]|nr:hypothetical protein [Nitrospinota bacterium]
MSMPSLEIKKSAIEFMARLRRNHLSVADTHRQERIDIPLAPFFKGEYFKNSPLARGDKGGCCYKYSTNTPPLAARTIYFAT